MGQAAPLPPSDPAQQEDFSHLVSVLARGPDRTCWARQSHRALDAVPTRWTLRTLLALEAEGADRSGRAHLHPPTSPLQSINILSS